MKVHHLHFVSKGKNLKMTNGQNLAIIDEVRNNAMHLIPVIAQLQCT